MQPFHFYTFSLSICTFLSFALAENGKVLFSVSSLFPVHRFVLRDLAEELVKRGNKVVWWEIGLKRPDDIPLPKGVEERYWEVSVPESYINNLFLHKNSSVYDNIWDPTVPDISLKAANWLISSRICDAALATRKGDLDKLVAENFDTAVVDDLYNPAWDCHLISLKKAVMTPLRTETAWATHSPSPPSYVPVPGTGYIDELDFWQRSYNFASYIKQIYIHQKIVLRRLDTMFQKYYPGLPQAFYMERNASINLINTPPIFDFPRSFMPRVNFVGGLHCKNASKLQPAALQKFVDGADNENGFILFTTGFTVPWSRAPKEVIDLFVSAFKETPKVRFVWQYDGPEIKGLPGNVFVQRWLPQQDLLGHAKCKALLSHGGLNSVIEAVWHKVPVIGIPILSEHKDYILRATQRRSGLLIEKQHLNTLALKKAFYRIATDEKMVQGLWEFNDLIRDVPYTELNHSAFWVEFIIRHQEVPVARSGADDLNIAQYFLLDVIAFVLGCVLLCVLATFYCCKYTVKAMRCVCARVCDCRQAQRRQENTPEGARQEGQGKQEEAIAFAGMAIQLASLFAVRFSVMKQLYEKRTSAVMRDENDMEPKNATFIHIKTYLKTTMNQTWSFE